MKIIQRDKTFFITIGQFIIKLYVNSPNKNGKQETRSAQEVDEP